ncbi:PilW family protein [Chromatocurvus halotolerans]|uniref:Type IV pilus-assembly PilW-like protein n=1 Tax=Chromatocurvus halotolerans TaxID=1132028 RepID=A0A4R2KLE2_9GAMM|nr:PilW family protein [Chromatocurvus halotolerans]TCO74861.1 type IV pilus-assembly PilW-like protein [Chromatocurvus halotolerans]
MKRAGGVTLVELLLSITLAMLLVASVLQVYRIGKAVLRWQVEVARMEESGRHALGLLVRELRMVGFFAREAMPDLPAPVTAAPACGDVPGWALDLHTPLDMLDDFSGGAARFSSGARLACLPESRLVTGADALVIKRSSALPSLTTGREPELRPLRWARWYLVIAAAGSSDMALVDAAGHSSRSMSDGSRWWELHTHIFYLRDYSQEPGDGIPALCDERLGSTMRSVCLVEGVEGLQAEFAIDADGDGVAESLLRAPGPGQLSAATTAHVHVLIRSLNPVHRLPRAQSLQLGTTAVDLPADRYLRRVFSATVPLHNLRAQANAHVLP